MSDPRTVPIFHRPLFAMGAAATAFAASLGVVLISGRLGLASDASAHDAPPNALVALDSRAGASTVQVADRNVSDPAAPSPAKPSENPENPGPGRGWLPPGLPANLPSEEEWTQIGDFMQQHSPVRWRLSQQALSVPGRSDLPRRLIYGQFLELQKLESSDSQEFKQRVGQIELEDQIFDAESQLRDAEAKDSPDVAQLREAFEAKVKAHYDRELSAKEARIDRLEAQLHQQRAALEAEKQRETQTLQQRIEFARRLCDWFRGWASGSVRLPFPRPAGSAGKSHDPSGQDAEK